MEMQKYQGCQACINLPHAGGWAYRSLEHGVIGLETAGALLPQVTVPGHRSDVASHTVSALCHKDTAITVFQMSEAATFGNICWSSDDINTGQLYSRYMSHQEHSFNKVIKAYERCVYLLTVSLCSARRACAVVKPEIPAPTTTTSCKPPSYSSTLSA